MDARTQHALEVAERAELTADAAKLTADNDHEILHGNPKTGEGGLIALVKKEGQTLYGTGNGDGLLEILKEERKQRDLDRDERDKKIKARIRRLEWFAATLIGGGAVIIWLLERGK